MPGSGSCLTSFSVAEHFSVGFILLNKKLPFQQLLNTDKCSYTDYFKALRVNGRPTASRVVQYFYLQTDGLIRSL
jgi:hypothetical protein